MTRQGFLLRMRILFIPYDDQSFLHPRANTQRYRHALTLEGHMILFETKHTKLRTAIKNGDSASVRRLLEAQPSLLNKPIDKRGNTPLHLAAQMLDKKPVVKLLLDLGADVHAKNRRGGPPLLYAWDREVVAMLLNAGADVNASDSFGETPLHNKADEGDGCLDAARLLLDSGADINARTNKGETPLDAARRQPTLSTRIRMIPFLKERGGHCATTA